MSDKLYFTHSFSSFSKTLLLLLAAVLFVLGMTSCATSSERAKSEANANDSAAQVERIETKSKSYENSSNAENEVESAQVPSSPVNEQPQQTTQQSQPSATDAPSSFQTQQKDFSWMIWDEAKAPNYVLEYGQAYVGETPPAGTIVYGELDYLGRSTAATGSITKALRDAGSANGHDDFGSGDDPSGWPAKNWEADIMAPNGKNYHGYFWNRSHLIADSLGGEAIKRNAVTGARMQNVGANNGDDAGGMAYCEVRARKWLDSHVDGSLYYRAEPVYLGEELIPRVVVVDMKSSDGTLDKHVIVYNAAKGFDIDYSGSGSNVMPTAGTAPTQSSISQSEPVVQTQPVTQLEPTTQPEPAPVVQEQPQVISSDDLSRTVYITKTGDKYHFDPHCSGLSNANILIPTTLQEVPKRLAPCSICAGG